MRFAVATCLTLATAFVEARPSTLSVDVSNLNVEQSMDNAVRPRGLGDVLHNALNKQPTTTSSETSSPTPVTTSSSTASATSSTNSSAMVSSSSGSGTTVSTTPTQTSSLSSSSTSSTPSSSSSTDSSSSSPLSLGSLLGGSPKQKDSEDTKAETYGNDKISTYHSLGTTGDRIGFRWVPVNSSD